jgi:hypothetical protein
MVEVLTVSQSVCFSFPCQIQIDPLSRAVVLKNLRVGIGEVHSSGSDDSNTKPIISSRPLRRATLMIDRHRLSVFPEYGQLASKVTERIRAVNA